MRACAAAANHCVPPPTSAPLPSFLPCVQADSKVTLVYGQMNEPPGARARVALTGLTGEAVAEAKAAHATLAPPPLTR